LRRGSGTALSRFGEKEDTLAMHDLPHRIVRFLRNEDGPTAVEYAVYFLLLVLTALTIITAIGQATAGGPVPM